MWKILQPVCFGSKVRKGRGRKGNISNKLKKKVTTMSVVILIPASLANVSTFGKHSVETFFFLNQSWEMKEEEMVISKV